MPIHQFDRLPSYYIFAGLVFTPLTQPYLHEYGDDWYNTSPRRLCMRALTAHPLKPGQQLVILSQVGGLLIYASWLVYTYKIALWFSSVLQFVNSWTPCLLKK